jgi:CubicO group peptidase (beta-lactamase class C family)
MASNFEVTADAERIGKRAEALVEEAGCPGMSVAVVDGSETVLTAGYGNRRLDPAEPATPDTLYGIGSSTKPITATAVLTLVEDGRVSLDDAVSSYVPYYEDAPGAPIEVGELLSHTSGMPSDDAAAILLSGSVLDDELERSLDGWEELRAHVAGSVDRRLTDEQRCLYYNTGYMVLSRLVETVAGAPFDEYVAASVLGPLGMDRSTFDVGVLDDDRDAMTPYHGSGGEVHGVDYPDSPLLEAPGGLLAPVTDLAAFVGAWAAGDPPIAPGLAERATDPVGVMGRFRDGTELGYGLGWGIRPFGDDVLVGHSGGSGVSAGYLGFLERSGIGVAFGCNARPDLPEEVVAIELLAAATGTDPADLPPKRPEPDEDVTGAYETYSGLRSATVTRTDGLLELETDGPTGTDSVYLTPLSTDPADHTYRVAKRGGLERTVEFFVEDDGVGMLVERDLYERVDDLRRE